ncbi:MAG: hypothetical protein ABSH15_10845 [Verrucomicrobiota bacterium]
MTTNRGCSILRRVQAAGAGAKGDVGLVRVIEIPVYAEANG